jgi:selenoprotein W-related protein
VHELTVNYFSGVCDFTRECAELKKFLNETVPDAKVSCIKSKSRGSFEVKINDVLVHSKMQTIAFPVYEDVAENVRNCQQGKAMKIVAQQKITDCCIS